jgi:hypothetical protein
MAIFTVTLRTKDGDDSIRTLRAALKVDRDMRGATRDDLWAKSEHSHLSLWVTYKLLASLQSRVFDRGGDHADKSGTGGGTDNNSLNRTGPTATMPTRMHVGNRERRN